MLPELFIEYLLCVFLMKFTFAGEALVGADCSMFFKINYCRPNRTFMVWDGGFFSVFCGDRPIEYNSNKQTYRIQSNTIPTYVLLCTAQPDEKGKQLKS